MPLLFAEVRSDQFGCTFILLGFKCDHVGHVGGGVGVRLTLLV